MCTPKTITIVCWAYANWLWTRAQQQAVLRWALLKVSSSVPVPQWADACCLLCHTYHVMLYLNGHMLVAVCAKPYHVMLCLNGQMLVACCATPYHVMLCSPGTCLLHAVPHNIISNACCMLCLTEQLFKHAVPEAIPGEDHTSSHFLRSTGTVLLLLVTLKSAMMPQTCKNNACVLENFVQY